jgi:hypothetical protein
MPWRTVLCCRCQERRCAHESRLYKDGHYFIHGDVIARLFRGKLLYRLYEEGFAVPQDLPKDWVTNVKHIGKGLPALQYLSRYLYRGVLSEKAILKIDATQVTFRYQDAQTRKMTLAH